jgi:hypothetical protein
MATLRDLTASAVCAALLGLASSRLVGPRLLGFATTGEAAPEPESSQTVDFGQRRSTLRPEDEPRPDGDSSERGGDTLSAVESGRMALETRIAAKPRRGRARERFAHSARSAVSGVPDTSAADTFAADLDRGIRKVGERRYQIERRTLDLALANLRLLSRFARVAPERHAGKPLGFRLFAIAPEGPFWKLGLRNQDVLHSVNGLDIRTPDQALEAYTKLKTARHLVLGLLRGGHESAQEYIIR